MWARFAPIGHLHFCFVSSPVGLNGNLARSSWLVLPWRVFHGSLALQGDFPAGWFLSQPQVRLARLAEGVSPVLIRHKHQPSKAQGSLKDTFCPFETWLFPPTYMDTIIYKAMFRCLMHPDPTGQHLSVLLDTEATLPRGSWFGPCCQTRARTPCQSWALRCAAPARLGSAVEPLGVQGSLDGFVSTWAYVFLPYCWRDSPQIYIYIYIYIYKYVYKNMSTNVGFPIGRATKTQLHPIG